MTCAFTGHRPEKLPWGSAEDDPRCRALKAQILSAIERALAAGVRNFSCGMARGCDFYFADCVLELERVNPEITLEAWLPCKSQPDRWPVEDQRRYASLLRRCSRVIYTEQTYSEGCMLRRNRAMLDAADMLISVYAGGGGGSGQAVAYAREKGLPIDALWL